MTKAFCVIVGNPIDGMDIVGPFSNADDAQHYLEAIIAGDDEWRIVRMYAPPLAALDTENERLRVALRAVVTGSTRVGSWQGVGSDFCHVPAATVQAAKDALEDY